MYQRQFYTEWSLEVNEQFLELTYISISKLNQTVLTEQKLPERTKILRKKYPNLMFAREKRIFYFRPTNVSSYFRKQRFIVEILHGKELLNLNPSP